MDRRVRFQKIVLLVIAGMIVLFGVLTAIFRTHKGVEFYEGLLRMREQDGQTVYSGEAYDTPVTITVTKTPGNDRLTTVQITIAGVADDVCQVEYPLDPIETEFGARVPGVRITKNGALLFAGGYDPENAPGWYNLDGTRAFGGVSIMFSTGTNRWGGYETGKEDVMPFALGSELSARGSWAGYAAMTLWALVMMALVRFGLRLHVWKMSWYARDPEPTEFYYTTEKIGWVFAAAVLLFGYCFALSVIA